MSIISCYNIKGGVGKTSTTLNLGYLSACEGKRTLLWDLDLQGSVNYLLGQPPPEKKSIKVFGGDKATIKKRLQPSRFKKLDVLPADFSLYDIDKRLNEAEQPSSQIQKILASLQKKYDNIIIDSPPGFSILSRNLLKAIDVLLIPVLPSPLAMDAFESLRKEVKKESNRNLLVFPFFSMVDRRKQLHRKITELHLNGKRGFLHTVIPYSSKVEQMAVNQAPLFTYDTRSIAAKAYKALWSELQTNVGMHDRVKKIKMW